MGVLFLQEENVGGKRSAMQFSIGTLVTLTPAIAFPKIFVISLPAITLLKQMQKDTIILDSRINMDSFD